MLVKDGSTFEDMFSLDLRSMVIGVHDLEGSSALAQQEGETDDNPICLEGDNVDEFRALLWSLYALYVRPLHR